MSHLDEVCKMGQGKDTCRYLTMGPDGFECAKLGPLRYTIDERVKAGTLGAHGDNCEGRIGVFE